MSTSDKVDLAVNRLRALRKLEKFTQTRTTRAQNEILRALDPEVLTEVALAMEAAGWFDTDKADAQ
jgi:hypothetical protein